MQESVSWKALKESHEEMFTRRKKILKGNVAFTPLVLLLALFGFHLENAERNKIFRLLQSVILFLALLVVSPFIVYKVHANVVVATIACINASCLYWTSIILYTRSLFPRRGKSLLSVFDCIDNIDRKLSTSFDIKIKDGKCFIPVMLLLLAISAFASFAFECWNDKMLNVGQFVNAMLVFVLSVKIAFYCTLCASIKARFQALIKYMKDSKSRQTALAVKCVASKLDIVDVTSIKEISLIYDEVLEIISTLNDSFSTLLAAAFGKTF